MTIKTRIERLARTGAERKTAPPAPIAPTSAAPIPVRGAQTADPAPPAPPVSTAPSTDARLLEFKSTILSRSATQAAFTLKALGKCSDVGDLDVDVLIDELGRRARAFDGGDLTHAEQVLLAQVSTLDFVYNVLTRKAARNLGSPLGDLDSAERLLRLGLKAQSQCRTTLETLAAIKNPPPVAFVRQANIAHGPQQVNNGAQRPTTGPSRAGENESRPTELLEVNHGERLDCGAPGTAGRADPQATPVGALHRAEDG